jgi:hypothetical protein
MMSAHVISFGGDEGINLSRSDNRVFLSGSSESSSRRCRVSGAKLLAPRISVRDLSSVMRDCSASASGSALKMRNFSSSLFCGCEHHHRGEREASWLHHPPFKP